MPHWDLLLDELQLATMTDGYGIVRDAAIAIRDGRIAWAGPAAERPDGDAAETVSLGGRWATPALIDCHTHLVFAGNRAAEFAMRLEGASYEEIARAGGGIMSTVRQTREASREALLEQASARLLALRAGGCATVEIKSGYGLDVETELRLLEVARELGRQAGVSVHATCLGAHAVPAEYRESPDAYIDLVCNELLPVVAERNLADSVDAYVESFAFSAAQIERVFQTARDLGLPVRLHADQLSDGDGAALAARFGALSADHLEYANDAGIAAMAAAGTVAVLLPGAFVTLNEDRLPPLDALREHGVPIAVATDCNPGTSPLVSLLTAMALAASQFRLTPAECLQGVTRHAARALDCEVDRGTIETGKRADIAVWNVSHPDELSYWLGLNPLERLYVSGTGVA